MKWREARAYKILLYFRLDTQVEINRTRPRHLPIDLSCLHKIGRQFACGGRNGVRKREGKGRNLCRVAFDDELHIDAAQVECLAWVTISQVGKINGRFASGGVENEAAVTRII